MNVILAGFMGTGKSAIGRRVAERLGRRLLDTDALIEAAEGMSVRELFAACGEKHFRACEREAVRKACAEKDVVIATGGGTILDDENFQRLESAGLMVCLTARPSEIARRVRPTAPERPVLQVNDPGVPLSRLTARITELLEQRQRSYGRIPLQIDTSADSIERVADTIIAALADAEGTRSKRPS